MPCLTLIGCCFTICQVLYGPKFVNKRLLFNLLRSLLSSPALCPGVSKYLSPFQTLIERAQGVTIFQVQWAGCPWGQRGATFCWDNRQCWTKENCYSVKAEFSSREILVTWEKHDLNCYLQLNLLKDYKACPALNGQSWAEENWHSLGALVEKIRYLAKKKKKKWYGQIHSLHTFRSCFNSCSKR